MNEKQLIEELVEISVLLKKSMCFLPLCATTSEQNKGLGTTSSLRARYCALQFIGVTAFHPKSNPGNVNILIPILYMRKGSSQRFSKLAQRHKKANGKIFS